jgi:hypothetical protein
VLSDKNKRAVYDQFGEEGLKGAPAEGPGGGGGGSGGGGAGMPAGFRFAQAGGGGGGAQFRDPRVIFSQFFGTANPFAAFGGGGMDDMMGMGIGGGRGGGGGGGGAFGGFGGAGVGGPPGGKPQAEVIKRPLACSLEDLFSKVQEGSVKELNVVVKADVFGSVEAIKESLIKLSTPKVKVKVLFAAPGGITESDVLLATASGAIVTVCIAILPFFLTTFVPVCRGP